MLIFLGVVEFRLLQFVSVFSAVFAGRCASVVGFGGLSFVPRTFPCCLVFSSWVFGCFGRLGARTGSASVQTASGHCSGASQVRITGENLQMLQVKLGLTVT